MQRKLPIRSLEKVGVIESTTEIDYMRFTKRTCYLLTLVFAGILLGTRANGQDIHFSQFFEAPLLRNPSLAGIYTGDIRVQAVYRDQWNSVTNAYKTASVNGEYKMPIGKMNDFITIGLQFLYDKAGTV